MKENLAPLQASKQASSLRQKPTSVNYLKNLVPIGQEEGQPLGTLVEQDIPVTFLFSKVKMREGEPQNLAPDSFQLETRSNVC